MNDLINDFHTTEDGKTVCYKRLDDQKTWCKEVLGEHLEVIESHQVVFGTKYVSKDDVIKEFKHLEGKLIWEQYFKKYYPAYYAYAFANTINHK